MELLAVLVVVGFGIIIFLIRGEKVRGQKPPAIPPKTSVDDARAEVLTAVLEEYLKARKEETDLAMKLRQEDSALAMKLRQEDERRADKIKELLSAIHEELVAIRRSGRGLIIHD